MLNNIFLLVATGKTSLLVQKIFEFYKIKFDTFSNDTKWAKMRQTKLNDISLLLTKTYEYIVQQL